MLPALRCHLAAHRRTSGVWQVGDEWLEVETAIAGGHAKLLGDMLAVVIGGAEVLGLAWLAHRAEGTRAR